MGGRGSKSGGSSGGSEGKISPMTARIYFNGAKKDTAIIEIINKTNRTLFFILLPPTY